MDDDGSVAVGLDQPVSGVLSVGVVVEGTQVFEGGPIAELVLILYNEKNKQYISSAVQDIADLY